MNVIYFDWDLLGIEFIFIGRSYCSSIQPISTTNCAIFKDLAAWATSCVRQRWSSHLWSLACHNKICSLAQGICTLILIPTTVKRSKNCSWFLIEILASSEALKHSNSTSKTIQRLSIEPHCKTLLLLVHNDDPHARVHQFRSTGNT